MSVSDADIAHIRDLFADMGAITTRRMMGGLSIYHDGKIFAMLDSAGVPYLKAKGAFAARLAVAGARQFGAGTGQKMGYWTLPEAACDDPALACAWANEALDANNG